MSSAGSAIRILSVTRLFGCGGREAECARMMRLSYGSYANADLLTSVRMINRLDEYEGLIVVNDAGEVLQFEP